MNSDALVVFGVTGDLAYKKIFPALQSLVARGQLNVPIVGVGRTADGPRAADRARAEQRVEREAPSTRPRSRASRRCCSTCPATMAISTRSRRSGRRSATAKRPLFYLAIPPSAFPMISRASVARRLHRGRAGRHRKAVRARPRVGPRAQRDAASRVFRGRDLPHRSLPRQGSGAEHPVLPVRECVSRADLEPAVRRERAHHDGRVVRRRRARRVSTRRRASSATSCRTTCCRSSAISRWSRRLRRGAKRCATSRRRCCARFAPVAGGNRARPVSRVPRAGRRQQELERSDLCRPRSLRRLVALAWRAVSRDGGQVPQRHAHRSARQAEAGARRGLRRARTARGQSRALHVVAAGEHRGRRAREAAGRRHVRRAGRAVGDGECSRRAASTRTSASSATRWRAIRRCSRDRMLSRRRGPSWTRCSSIRTRSSLYECGSAGPAEAKTPRRRRMGMKA